MGSTLAPTKKSNSRRHLPTADEHQHRDPDEKHCNGKKSKKANEYCQQPPGWGTDHAGVGRCKMHGGSAPNYQKQVTKLRAAALVETYGLPRDIDPHDALLEELARTAGHVDWLRVQVGNLEHSEFPDGNAIPNNKGSKLVGPVGGGNEGYPSWEPSVWIQMYNDERKHLVNVSKECIRAGIEERRVRLAESQGQIIANVLRRVLTELNVLDLPQTPAVVRAALEEATGPMTITGSASEVGA